MRSDMDTTAAMDLVTESSDWLRATYGDHRFFVERDLVWTVQRWLGNTIRREGLPLRVYHDYPIAPGTRRAQCTDLAIVDAAGQVLVAIEFKYEPDHARGAGDVPEIWPTKLDPSVVFWGKEGVLKDVERCRQYVQESRCMTALSLFVDEGGTFRHREPHSGTRWEDWECGGETSRRICVLRGRFDRAV